jgi:TolB protein
MPRRLLVVLAWLACAAASAPAADEGTARVVVSTGSSAMPSWMPGDAQILFHSRRKDTKQGSFPTRNIWMVNADGSGERRLTNGTKDEYHATPSPDGKKIAFVSELNGSRDIWIVDADGQNAVPLTDDPGTEDHPAWSPDSRQIAYAAFPKEGGSFDLWLVNADGSGRRRLTTTAANELFPAWHPNGEQLAYVTDASGNFDIYTISVRDGRTTPLVVSPDQEARPAWSPDGTKIAFARWPARGRSTDAGLWVANADGTAPIELTTASAPATHPAWSADGRRLAFQHRGQTGWEIAVLDLPPDIVQTGRIRLAQQIRSGADVDTAQLKNGDTLRGTLRETGFRLRAPYGALDLPRAVVASILVDERGLARVVLANGDSLSGLLETSEIHLVAASRTETIAVERLAQLSLRAGGRAAAVLAGFRAVMRNGDSLSLMSAFGPLRLRVGGSLMEAEPGRIDHVEFAEAGDRAQVVLTTGDSLSGELTGGRLELTLAAGPRLAVDPSSVRTLARLARKR